MYDKFMSELSEALERENISDKESVLEAYKDKYDKLVAAGKSEFEAIMALGEPAEIACNIAGRRSSTLQKLERNLIRPDESAAETNLGGEKVEEPAVWSPEQDSKTPTKLGVYLGDIFYLAPSLIISAFGIIATAFVGALIGAAGCKYLVKAWTQFTALSSQFTAFAMALCAIALCIGALYLCYRLGNVIVVSCKRYFKVRSAKLDYIDSIQS